MRDWPSGCGLGARRRRLPRAADRRVLLLGFASGLPLALTFGTLTFWLAEAGVDKASIGLFALVGIAYGWKFLWSPVIDHVPLPLLTRRLGRRRGWLLLVQLGLILSIIGARASAIRPRNLWRTALLAVLVAFLLGQPGHRHRRLPHRDPRRAAQQGAGAAMIVVGYRVAMLVSGAGALLIADPPAGRPPM